ncbi:MAG: site-specific integrase, partial [Oscillospiraceae bacterium]|nr:site-specific integrase [Oscillospiraceae bacterium]
DSPALFAGKGSDRLQPGGVRHMLEQIGIRAKVDNVHPHRFRRTLATNLISRGMSIQEVAAILGHDNINTTMTYVYLDQSAVKNSYHKYSA